jgi:hypothetical protein
MKNLIIPVICKNNKRVIENSGQFSEIDKEYREEIRKIYNSIEGIEISFNKVLGDILQSNYSEDHYLCKYNNSLNIVFVNVDKIPMYHSVESIGKAILNNQ